MSEIDRRVNTALRDAVRQRNYRRVRDRALARLKKLHPEDYARLFEEERERDEAEGRAWRSIRGRVGDSHTIARHTPLTSTKDRPNQTNRNDEEDSESGAEA